MAKEQSERRRKKDDAYMLRYYIYTYTYIYVYTVYSIDIHILLYNTIRIVVEVIWNRLEA